MLTIGKAGLVLGLAQSVHCTSPDGMALPDPVQPSHCRCCDPNVDIWRGADVLGEGGYCFVIVNDHNFALFSAGLHSICVRTVSVRSWSSLLKPANRPMS